MKRMISRFISALFYYLIILPISALPYFVLYRISDFLYILFFYVLGYRKNVIVGNIKRSFPEKSGIDHIDIAKKFYAHFCDLIVESLKVFSISESQVQRRMKFVNPEVMNRYFDEGKSVIMAGGHFNNWELFAVAIDSAIKHNSIAIYKPLSNQFFDVKMRATRGKYGLRMIAIKDVKKVFDETQHEVSTFIFGTDQSPGNVKKAYWMNFLNQETAVLFGAEKFAKDYNYPVVFCCIHKVRRGFYEVEFRNLVADPAACEFGEITQLHTQMLEKDILNAPPYWLWSHRRWKKKRPEEAELHKSL
ncbi:MAG: lysophospholipid acyltransferase family protein [Bacteroidia bacterium]|nr:lysophospholipid acyltransferase family protein [Bacteroidia bacterium]